MDNITVHLFTPDSDIMAPATGYFSTLVALIYQYWESTSFWAIFFIITWYVQSICGYTKFAEGNDTDYVSGCTVTCGSL